MKKSVSIILAVSGVAVLVLGAIWIAFSGHKTTKASGPPSQVLPVTITFRPDPANKGFVGLFRNNTDEALLVLATFSDPKKHTARHFTLGLDPGRDVEFGAPHGWPFHSGDTIELRNAGFLDLTYQVP